MNRTPLYISENDDGWWGVDIPDANRLCNAPTREEAEEKARRLIAPDVAVFFDVPEPKEVATPPREIDFDEVMGELQNTIVLFERSAEMLEEKPEGNLAIRNAMAETYRSCADKLRATVERLGLDPYDGKKGVDPQVVEFIRDTSMASDQGEEELVAKVHSKLWDPTGYTPEIEPHEEAALAYIRGLSEDDAWDLITRTLKQIGHY